MASTINNIKITKQVDLGLEDILAGISNLETSELEQFLQKIGRLVASRKASPASERETTLLLAINQAIPKKLQDQYSSMVQKLEDETMTAAENKVFLKLVEKMEAKNGERLKYIIELSHIKGVPLETLMKQLHLNLTNVE